MKATVKVTVEIAVFMPFEGAEPVVEKEQVTLAGGTSIDTVSKAAHGMAQKLAASLENILHADYLP